MQIDKYVTIIKGADSSKMPLFCIMRNFEIINVATIYLQQKAKGQLFDWLRLANSNQAAGYDLTRYKSSRMLAASSMNIYAQDVKSFLQWCEEKAAASGDFEKYDFRNIENYKTQNFGAIEEYAEDLREQRFGDVTNPHRYAVQLHIANEFLMFCYAFGERTKPFMPFHVSKPRRAFGREQHDLKIWKIPSPSEIAEWISSLSSEEDQLIAELVCYSGFRADDVLSLQVKHVPSISDVTYADNDRVMFEVFDSKRSKDRITTMPEYTFLRLNQFIVKTRRKKLKSHGIKSSEYVFVSTHPRNFGKPYSARKVQNIFSDTDFGSKWHPHTGRHAFAVHRLIQLINNDVMMLGFSLGDALINTAMHQGPLVSLQAEMGHASVETTADTYLKYLQRHTQDVQKFSMELSDV